MLSERSPPPPPSAGGQETQDGDTVRREEERSWGGGYNLRYTRVCIRSGVDNYGRDLARRVLVAVRAEASCLLDAVHYGALVVGLEALEGHAEGLGLGFCRGHHVGEGGRAVNLGLAGPEQVQVWAVDEEDAGCHDECC